MHLVAVFLSLTLVACATPVAAPRIDVFSRQVPSTATMPGPTALPARPAAKQLHDDGGDYFAFDADGARRLVARDQVCEANTRIAAEAAAGYADLQRSDALLLHQAQLLEEQHNYIAQRWADNENELRERDREQLIETWVTRLFLVGVAIKVAE